MVGWIIAGTDRVEAWLMELPLGETFSFRNQAPALPPDLVPRQQAVVWQQRQDIENASDLADASLAWSRS